MPTKKAPCGALAMIRIPVCPVRGQLGVLGRAPGTPCGLDTIAPYRLHGQHRIRSGGTQSDL